MSTSSEEIGSPENGTASTDAGSAEGCDLPRRCSGSWSCCLSGGVGLFFEFLEGSIFFEFFDVVGQVGFFLFDLFLFNRTGGRSVRGLVGMLGHYYQLAI